MHLNVLNGFVWPLFTYERDFRSQRPNWVLDLRHLTRPCAHPWYDPSSDREGECCRVKERHTWKQMEHYAMSCDSLVIFKSITHSSLSKAWYWAQWAVPMHKLILTSQNRCYDAIHQSNINLKKETKLTQEKELRVLVLRDRAEFWWTRPNVFGGCSLEGWSFCRPDGKKERWNTRSHDDGSPVGLTLLMKSTRISQ